MYPALLPLMRTPQLPVIDETDTPADLNGLVRSAERRNLVSTRVPSHFKRSLLRSLETLTLFASRPEVLILQQGTLQYAGYCQDLMVTFLSGWACVPECNEHLSNVGRENSDGITTRYGMDGTGIESWWARDFPRFSRPALGPTQPPVQWVPGLSRG